MVRSAPQTLSLADLGRATHASPMARKPVARRLVAGLGISLAFVVALLVVVVLAINVEKAISAFSNSSPLLGQLSGNMNVRGFGVEWATLRDHLNGTLTISLKNGALTTTNIGEVVRDSVSKALAAIGKGGEVGREDRRRGRQRGEGRGGQREGPCGGSDEGREEGPRPGPRWAALTRLEESSEAVLQAVEEIERRPQGLVGRGVPGREPERHPAGQVESELEIDVVCVARACGGQEAKGSFR